MFIVWSTYRNLDMTEGRGPMVLDKVFSKEEDANEYVMQQDGVMGRKPADFGNDSWEGMGEWQVRPTTVLESLQEEVEYERESALQSGLAKLTQAERRAVEMHARRAL